MLESTLLPRRLSDIAGAYGLALHGEDREVVTVGPLNSRSQHRDRLLTFVTGASWLEAFAAAPDLPAAIVPRAIATDDLPAGKALLVTDGDAEAVFWELLADTVERGEWSRLEDAVGEGAEVHRAAVVEPGVQLGRDCRVMAGAVVLSGTRLGDGVVVKPNATVGGEGFQVREIRGRRRIVPHAGGVDVGDGAMIGSSTCVDRGLFGDATSIGAGAQVDNLVHVAHSVRIGREATVVACAEVSGSVVVGDGAWLGPNSAVNPSLVIGDHAFAGTGAVVVRDVPAHALVYGNPARAGGWVCVCHTKLHVEDGRGFCPKCGRAYVVDAAGVRPDVG